MIQISYLQISWNNLQNTNMIPLSGETHRWYNRHCWSRSCGSYWGQWRSMRARFPSNTGTFSIFFTFGCCCLNIWTKFSHTVLFSKLKICDWHSWVWIQICLSKTWILHPGYRQDWELKQEYLCWGAVLIMPPPPLPTMGVRTSRFTVVSPHPNVSLHLSMPILLCQSFTYFLQF